MRRSNRVHRILIPIMLALVAGACSRVTNSPDDSQIVSAIDAKLYQSPDLKVLPVNVSSKDGVVTLTGTVNASLEKLVIEDLAMKTSGVKQVVNQLEVTGDQSTQAANQVATPAENPAAATAVERLSTTKRAAEPVRRPVRRSQRRRRQVAENNARPDPGQAQSNGAADSAPAPETQPDQPAQPVQDAAPAQPAPPSPPPPVQVSIPSGATISVRMIDSINSQTAQAGQLYAASLFAPVVANGRVVIPQGADAKVRVVQVTSAGHYKGRSELKLELVRLSYNGTDYPVETGYYVKQGASRGKNTAEKVGGGAVLGALIGGLIGHGRGAAAGAAIGGAAGTVDQTATHGQQVTVPTEAKIDFTLKTPLSVTLGPGN